MTREQKVGSRKVAAVVALFNGERTIINCLKNLLNQTYRITEILVVDDCSTDSSVALVEQIVRQEERITLVRNGENLGVGSTISCGLTYALDHGYDWIWLFDQDSYPLTDCLERLMDAIDNCDSNNWGIVSPKFINPDDPEMYNYRVLWGDKGYIVQPQPSHLTHEYDVGITSGSLVRKEVVTKVGTFRLDFYCSLEDHEFFLRVREAGFKVVRVTTAILHHRIGNPQKVRFLGKNYTLAHHPPWRCYYFFRNDIIIFRQRLGIRGAIRRLLELFDLMIVLLIFEQKRLHKLLYTIEGVVDGFRGRTGKTHKQR